MEINSPPPCPNIVTVRRNPPRRARPTPYSNPPQNLIPPSSSSSNSNKPEITPFPIQEILSMEIPQNPQPVPPSTTPILGPDSENLKVYLRIRPLVPRKPPSKDVTDQNFRQRYKNAWPQNPVAKKNATREKNTKKKSSEVCISVNDYQSVTLSPPQALQDSKRIKSMVYEGFSHVFASDSSQNAVYETMVKPLVEDFLNGKNGMLAALGPSGSGKTHTVFGTAREPGMVPLALQHIFKQTQGIDSKLTRSFYISIFEICSEGGKAERMFDLSPDGTDLSMQQSTIKGLQEVAVTDAAQAESLIASSMLKRATAMTNSNSQSSRSQCIINIHSLINQCNGGQDVQSNDAFLTIVDLAGAERERKTGNQGSRLLESNFINNTSMVFGLCLRSLLEHQKNPKKPLQKHFQNSLLTRYLRDYLEGKKRMALILTVKPGEEDYPDTVYLLRQASPYMKIKFNNLDEQPNSVHHKRQIQSLAKVEEPKRKKYCGLEAHVIEEKKSIGEEHSLLEEDAPVNSKLDSVDIATVKSECSDLTIKHRNHQIMQNFAKALWNVLKEYREKLMVAEQEIESLNENLRNEKARSIELEKKLEDFESCCTCSKENLVEATFHKVDTDAEAPVYLEGNECINFNEILVTKSKFDNSPTMCNLDQDLFTEMNVSVRSPDHKTSECNSTCAKCDMTIGWDMDLLSQVDVKKHSPNLKASECTGTLCDQDVTCQVDNNVHSPNLKESKCSSSPRWDRDILSQKTLDPPVSHKEVTASIKQCNLDVPDCERSNTSHKSLNIKKPKRRVLPVSSTLLKDITASGIEGEPEKPKLDENVHSPSLKESKCSTPRRVEDISAQKPLNPPSSDIEDAAFIKECNLNVPDCEMRFNTSCKSLNSKKPKRRLLPVSSILLRDITGLGIEDEAEKPKGNRGGKKLIADERTQGSISLLRLLQTNLRL